jgi:hypothetical protein
MKYIVINTATFSDDMVTAAEMSERRGPLADMIEAYSLQPGIEVIVVGQYQHSFGDGYTHLRVAPEMRDNTDRFIQRASAIKYLRGREPGPVLWLDDDTGLRAEDAYDCLEEAERADYAAWSFEGVTTDQAILTTFSQTQQAIAQTNVKGHFNVEVYYLPVDGFPW